MEVIPEEGTLIGWDSDTEIFTPYDECVLIMPSRRLRKGESAVRFGRFVDYSAASRIRSSRRRPDRTIRPTTRFPSLTDQVR